MLDVGLDFNVGAGGRRLTVAQRQKIDVARALIKRADYPDLQPAAAASSTSACRIRSCATCSRRHKRDGRKPAIIWVLSNPAMSQLFDRVMVFDRGELVEDGTHETLSTKNGIFKGLLA